MNTCHMLRMLTIAGVLVLVAHTTNADVVITPHGNGNVTTTLAGDADVANLSTAGAVGGNGPANRVFHQISAYNIADLLDDLGESDLAALSGYTFTYTADTAAGPDLADTATYTVSYIGAWSDLSTPTTDVPTTGTFNLPGGSEGDDTNSIWTRYHDAAEALFGGSTESTVDTGLNDTSSSQTIAASGFDLSGLATTFSGDGDLSNDYIFFGIKYGNISGVSQLFDSADLIAVVPTPAALTMGLAMLGAIAARRRR